MAPAGLFERVKALASDTGTAMARLMGDSSSTESESGKKAGTMADFAELSWLEMLRIDPEQYREV